MKLIRWSSDQPPQKEDLQAALTREALSPFVWSDPAGTSYPLHKHPFDEVRWVISGALRFGLPGADEEVQLGPGDRLEIPAHTLHWAKVVGHKPATYLCAWRESVGSGQWSGNPSTSDDSQEANSRPSTVGDQAARQAG